MQSTRPRITIQTANRQQVEPVWTFCVTHAGVSENQSAHDDGQAHDITPRRLSSLADDQTLLMARNAGELVGIGAISLDNRQLLGPLVVPERRGEGIGQRLLAALERLAASFQLYELEASASTGSASFLTRFGYQTLPGTAHNGAAQGKRRVSRRFLRRQTDYGRKVAEICRDLDIPADYGCRFRLPLQPEASRLVDAGQDVFGRAQRLTPGAAAAWVKMQDAAHQDGVQLDLVSAFRSVDYQAGLIQQKVERGVTMRDILAASAAPGFSEHHSGNAVDLTTPGVPVLEADFSETKAFQWLQSRAPDHGFHLSFPEGNRHGVLYEPWHWCFSPT